MWTSWSFFLALVWTRLNDPSFVSSVSTVLSASEVTMGVAAIVRASTKAAAVITGSSVGWTTLVTPRSGERSSALARGGKFRKLAGRSGCGCACCGCDCCCEGVCGSSTSDPFLRPAVERVSSPSNHENGSLPPSHPKKESGHSDTNFPTLSSLPHLNHNHTSRHSSGSSRDARGKGANAGSGRIELSLGVGRGGREGEIKVERRETGEGRVVVDRRR